MIKSSVGKVIPPRVKVRKSHSSIDPEKRARQLANLRPARNRETSRAAKSNDNNVPGLREFRTSPTFKMLVEFARENTPEAMQHVMEIMRGSYKARDRLYAAEIIMTRAFGRAPILVKVKGDEESPAPQPSLTGELTEAEWTRQVLEILRSAGALQSARQLAIETTATSVADDTVGPDSVAPVARGTT